MRVLCFPPSVRTGPGIQERAAPLEGLLAECRARRRLLRLERGKLALSLRRLRILARRMRRSRASLRRSRGRVQDVRCSILTS